MSFRRLLFSHPVAVGHFYQTSVDTSIYVHKQQSAVDADRKALTPVAKQTPLLLDNCR